MTWSEEERRSLENARRATYAEASRMGLMTLYTLSADALDELKREAWREGWEAAQSEFNAGWRGEMRVFGMTLATIAELKANYIRATGKEPGAE